jgi:hypothetical protein
MSATCAEPRRCRAPSGEPLADGAHSVGIAGVDRVLQLQEQHAGLLVGGWTVAHPAWQLAVDDQEQLVGVLMLVPDEPPWTLTSLTSSSLTVATILGCQ